MTQWNRNNIAAAALLGIGVLLGLAVLGGFTVKAVERFKGYERTVTVKGLAEREFPADIAIWPIQFTAADNDLAALYQTIASSSEKIQKFLQQQGIDAAAISVSMPSITDKSAQQYGGNENSPYRYTALQTVTVYSDKVATVREAMNGLANLGRDGIVFSQGNYQAQPEYIFTRLNEVKPLMVEEATKQARSVAEKFAEDSGSRLGKIRRASQGQFTIGDRDKNNPHIKKVRVVSTIEYYLAD
ncbi:SIMPL domain-containing protein [Microbulbifer harenosus]|uniref:SIMPL domain-containing protein n=1 Tax=Microbulbifer harenosus TaxID=2576840 RepID=A0ABY2ULP0_9GAMM|nr:SIMPL domain-containing protein [Microbulbifer harenosus]TLM79327.1 SIMPL domain-containing protein [Microbulbifer harenosus]